MKFLPNQVLIVLLLSCVLMRCAPVYVPTAHNVPMFSGKGEFQGSASAGLGLNGQTAYACTDHIGVTANYLYAKRDEDDRGRKHHSGEIALGYYTNFNERWCFEVFAGYGMGRGIAYDSNYNLSYYVLPIFNGDNYEANGTYDKIYVQPSIGLKQNDFTWSFSVKLSYVHAKEISIYRQGESWWSGETSKAFVSYVADGQMPLLKEKIFLHFQTGLNFPLGDDPIYDYEPFMASLGLVLKLKPK